MTPRSELTKSEFDVQYGATWKKSQLCSLGLSYVSKNYLAILRMQKSDIQQ